MNSYHGINNAADGKAKDGEAQYYSVENGPYGMYECLASVLRRWIGGGGGKERPPTKTHRLIEGAT